MHGRKQNEKGKFEGLLKKQLYLGWIFKCFQNDFVNVF